MTDLTLVIANKAYSSWSLRAWLGLVAAGAVFAEIVIPLDRPDSRAEILRHSPSGRVPALKHGDLTIWESIAILEYLAERFPAAGLWPEAAEARAVARSVAAEMHAGFAELRRHLPMDLKRTPAPVARGPAVDADIARICDIWRACRERFGADGPFLFGRFGIADAMYAPVATRFHSYAVAPDPVAQAYADAILAWPAMQAWRAAAAAEPWVIDLHRL